MARRDEERGRKARPVHLCRRHHGALRRHLLGLRSRDPTGDPRSAARSEGVGDDGRRPDPAQPRGLGLRPGTRADGGRPLRRPRSRGAGRHDADRFGAGQSRPLRRPRPAGGRRRQSRPVLRQGRAPALVLRTLRAPRHRDLGRADPRRDDRRPVRSAHRLRSLEGGIRSLFQTDRRQGAISESVAKIWQDAPPASRRPFRPILFSALRRHRGRPRRRPDAGTASTGSATSAAPIVVPLPPRPGRPRHGRDADGSDRRRAVSDVRCVRRGRAPGKDHPVRPLFLPPSNGP